MDADQYREAQIQRTIRYLTGPGEWPMTGRYEYTSHGPQWRPDAPWKPSDELVQEALRRLGR